MEEKRRNRFSPKNPPLRKWRWEGDEFLGKLKLVPEEWGWPAEGEPITDAIASLAISHRNGDTIARYLRQPNPWRHIVLRIADLFDPAKDGVEADRLDFVKRSNKHPMAQRRTDRYHYQIGYGISRMMKSGMKFERAVRKASSEYCVKRTTAIDAYKYYKKEQEREQSTTEKSKMFLTAPDWRFISSNLFWSFAIKSRRRKTKMAKRLRANDEELAVALATLGISRRSSNVRFWG